MPRQTRSSTRQPPPTARATARASTTAAKPSSSASQPAATAAATASTEPLQLPFESQAAWESWLAQNHASTPSGLWIRIAKKDSGIPSVTYDNAIDSALCWGWIDGQRKSLDADHFLQRFTPRRKNASLWSKRNVDKVAALTRDGRMRPPGLAEVEAAKADGRWERAYAGGAGGQIPPDFEAAMRKNGKAWETWEGLKKGDRYPFLHRVETAKRPETKERKIRQFVELLAEGKTLR